MPVLPGNHKPTGSKARNHTETMRPSSNKRGYTYKWSKARAWFIQENPLCVHCLRDNKVTPAKEVDHIQPHRGDMSLFWDRDNWQPLCKSCHSRKTATEDGGFTGRGASEKSWSLA